MSDSSPPLAILGAEGSPYSCKLRAILRFKRIPHRWIHQGSAEAESLPTPRVSLLPQLMLPASDGRIEARTDTTPLVRELERSHPDRAVVPSDSALAFLDALLEDYADEWLTKAMFHYRWHFPADIDNASKLLPRWSRPDRPDALFETFGKQFAERQIARLWVVGSNETTAPVIEDSYRRLLALLDARLTESNYLLGSRPSVCDFALFGQLTQLARVDPTPRAIAEADASRIVAWVDRSHDLSGIELDDRSWLAPAAIPASLRALLAEVGRVYVPFLLANADAIERGAERVECEIDGRDWVQKPFPYQRKCLGWLREGYRSLHGEARTAVDAALAGSGCEALFSA